MGQNLHLQKHSMNWIRKNIGSIGIWIYTISFAVYYILARPLDVAHLSHPVWVDNIEFYGSFIGITFISLGYAFRCLKEKERVLIAWGLVAFWGMLSLIYLLDEFLDSIIFTHKIISVTIFCVALCPLLYLYFRKR
jgi:hypothetical protein